MQYFLLEKAMCKKVLIFVLTVLMAKTLFAQDTFYEQVIYSDTIDDKTYQESISDLQIYLSKITGKNYKLKTASNIDVKGVCIVLNKHNILPHSLSEKLQQGTIEDFVLCGTREKLLIVANHAAGLTKGIYTYLDYLGMKWYFPGEKWEHIQFRESIIYAGAKHYSPSFGLRNFFGTGSIRHIPSIDASGKLQKEWDDWKRRNRLGGEFSLGGHYGETFNIKYKTELEKHPEYLALANGKRQWSTNAKWCVSNKDFRDFFVRDRISELRSTINVVRSSRQKIVLSVDPADGAGDCECESCKKLGSISNRYFLLANEVAKAFAKISPQAYVSLLAYNTHAAPASFPLAANVIVMIVPYAFQNFGTPKQMITAWTKYHKRIVMYDYYSIPDWHYDVPMPQKTSTDTLIKRIKEWKQVGIDGFMLESVYGTGVAGLGLYTASRLGWDSKSNTDEIKKAFLNDMFGNAAEKMTQYFDYINTEFKDASGLPYLRTLLREAKQTGDLKVKNRISDLEAYVHYLTLYYQLQSSKERFGKAWETLHQYIWEVYPLKVIHSTRLAELMYYKLDAANPLIKDWNIVAPYGKKLQQTQFLKPEEIGRLTEEDAKLYPVLEGFSYVRSSRYNYILKESQKPVIPEERMILGVNFPKTFVRASVSGNINFSFRLNDATEKSFFPIVIKCIDTLTGITIYSKTETIGSTWKNISLKVPINKTYRLILEYGPWILIRVPQNQWMAFAEIPIYTVMNTLWFYVPASTKYIYYSNGHQEQPVFKSSSGKIITPEQVNAQNMFRLNVANNQGTWWNISSSQYKSLAFYSIPGLFFTHPNYTVQLVN